MRTTAVARCLRPWWTGRVVAPLTITSSRLLRLPGRWVCFPAAPCLLHPVCCTLSVAPATLLLLGAAGSAIMLYPTASHHPCCLPMPRGLPSCYILPWQGRGCTWRQVFWTRYAAAPGGRIPGVEPFILGVLCCVCVHSVPFTRITTPPSPPNPPFVYFSFFFSGVVALYAGDEVDTLEGP